MADLRPELIAPIDDSEVDPSLDREIRGLLSTCFNKPGDEVFRTRRYFTEMPRRRWLWWDGDLLAAHVAVHERTLEAEIRMIGIAEVCVAPTHRGQGLVRGLLSAVHDWGVGHGFGFATLFGRPEIYASSGYRPCPKGVMVVDGGPDPVFRPPGDFLIRPLASSTWPTGVVDLRGPVF
ncbi:MAG: GNAT family N-acetyltransferase [Phycisphaerales bacterium]|nr:GNAT family N-acetyltransferase [Phycisphaerales bacterium]